VKTVDIKFPISDISLNNGVTMPALGLGVFQASQDVTATAVDAALRSGYRLIDTAAMYDNEREVGDGIRRSGVSRDEIFIETKIWPSDYGYEETLHAFEKSAKKLGIEVIDLLLLHQPATDRFEKTIKAYAALETLLEQGKVRAIGVSNFMPGTLAKLMEHARVTPTVNQIELHPYSQQRDAQKTNKDLGILTQAWAPIGGNTFYNNPSREDGRPSVMLDPTLAEIGEAHGKSPAQVMIRWHLQQGRSAIPKSTHEARIKENFDVFDFELSKEEMAKIDALDTGLRYGHDPDIPRPALFDRVVPEA
jgi:diketogulonate reductase-like aldo/keto reductase